MNFKTTVILIILLGAAAVWLFVSRDKPAGTNADATAAANLLDIDAKDVTKIIVTPADGPEFALEKQLSDWQLIEPVKAPAETFEVDALIRGFTEAKTHGDVRAAANASATGLAPPRYTVQLVTARKTVKLAVGAKSAIGDNLYVQVDGNEKAELIPSDVSDKLDKGADAYRKMALVNTAADQIKQITITTPQQTLVLQKQGTAWQMVAPQAMPLDDTAASDLTFALTGLRADSFVDPKSIPAADTARAQLTVAFSTDAPAPPPPATAPSTQPTFTTINFDAYEGIEKKNVYVVMAGSDSVAKVPATSLDQFRKKPIDLRDKKVLDLDPNMVSKIILETHLPSSTQPATRPAVDTTLVIEKRKTNPVMGPPSSEPATQTAATAPTTLPALTKYIVTSDPHSDADDAKVDALITALHPLKADRYLETVPTTRPAGEYTLTITSTGPFGSWTNQSKLSLTDPGHDQPLVGTYNGLTFETARSLLTDFQGSFAKKP